MEPKRLHLHPPQRRLRVTTDQSSSPLLDFLVEGSDFIIPSFLFLLSSLTSSKSSLPFSISSLNWSSRSSLQFHLNPQVHAEPAEVDIGKGIRFPTREAPTPSPKIISVSGAKNEPKTICLLALIITIFPFLLC